MKTLKKISTLGVLLLATSAALPAAEGAKATAKPNILFILSDDHASEAIGAYNSWLKGYVQTPTIDRLAAEGMRFTNMCVNNSICSPSRASIITGQYSHKNGVLTLTNGYKATSPTISEELKKGGYTTAIFGKWHMDCTPRGFDDYAITKSQGSYFDTALQTPSGTQKNQGYYTKIFNDHALNWLDKRDKSKPFALFVWYKGVHHPWDYPDQYQKIQAGVNVPEPATLHEDTEKTSPRLKDNDRYHMASNGASYYKMYKDDKELPLMGPAGSDKKSQESAAYQHLIHRYLSCVAALDDGIKGLLDGVAAKGINLDDTLIIYSSDQGYWLGQHGLYDKRLILDESLKMPFIVRYPKEIKAGTVNNNMCSNVDFAPTMLDYAGAPIPAAMQGHSLRPLLLGNAPADWRKAIWYSYWVGPAHYGIRTEKYTLVCFPKTEEIEFYDLEKDPQQTHSVAADPEYAAAIAATKKTLAETMVDVDIPTAELPGNKKASKGAPAGEEGDAKKPAADAQDTGKKKGKSGGK